MQSFKNKTVLITGASSGIGQAFATRFAELGANLILVARRQAVMEQLATQLKQQYAIEVTVLPIDLSKPESSEALYQTVKQRGLSVDTLVNNAGFGVYGALDKTDLQRNQEQICVNILAVSSLTQLFLADMVKNHAGNIINIASIAGFQPVSYMSVYAATKAFVLSFTEALWGEYRQQGIRVLAVCPGPVATEFFQAANMAEDVIGGGKETSISVVDKALRALERGKLSVVTGGPKNFILSQLHRLISRAFVVKTGEKMMRPK